MRYQAPVKDIHFLLNEVLPVKNYANLPGFEEATLDTLLAVVEEASKLASEVILPTNAVGDQEGCQYDPASHGVTTPTGFRAAYRAYVEGGWPGMSAPVEYGGQGLPHLLKFIVDEMVCSTNLSFGMYPGLSHGAVAALYHHADEALKARFLPKLVSGEWTGTMCLTEPQCGTDLRLIRTRAEPQADGTYAITGTKIWITGGEHDLTENIVHLVLAKLPGAPESTKGISMFIVPKFVPETGERNPAFCGGLEHKMGIKGSATCVMNFEGAKGWLVGEANEGMRYMFTMMNGARLMVGMQGLGLAETAYQISLAFAQERLQSRSLRGPQSPDKPADPILVHPDVRRMLLRQKVFNEGNRALAYWVAFHLDNAHANPDPAEREASDDLVQLMTPVVKAFLTDEGYANANWAQQVLGGSGFTVDWGIEQLVRDGRIARIYEGTNGIQAMDLVGRKLSLHGGRLIRRYMGLLRDTLTRHPEQTYAASLKGVLDNLQTATGWLASHGMKDSENAGAAASPYLRLVALSALAYLWAEMDRIAAERIAAGEATPFYTSKRKSAAYFFERGLQEASMLLADIESGKGTLMAHEEAELA
ncbi:MAG: acyl-CoA dehydrogenase C-terminal domain-containing protein [Hahellaceae bacterium]|nr:acyl-CoA dehydrogenase C-terminal domain-containing protein [Hahellaceae bacterium]